MNGTYATVHTIFRRDEKKKKAPASELSALTPTQAGAHLLPDVSTKKSKGRIRKEKGL